MIKDILSFYRGKKVLITGHTGFKGSWLTYWLLKNGASIVGFSDRITTNPSLFKLLNLQKDITHLVGDIRNQDLLINTIQDTKPEICFHLAAQPIVRLSYEDPMLTYTTNVNGSLNLLDSIRKTNHIKTIVMITSDKCYENQEWDFGYRESDSLGGHDPYSSSKACAELIIQTYRRSYFSKMGIGCASVRAGNVIGGGDWSSDRLLVDCVKSLSSSQEIVIRYPKATRPWQHVFEPLSGYLTVGKLLTEKPEIYAQAWNFGPREQVCLTVEDLVNKIISIWGTGSYRIHSENTSHEAGKLQLDIHKSTSLLGWYPKWNAIKAIEKTISWYKTYYENPTGNIRSLCDNQINAYEE